MEMGKNHPELLDALQKRENQKAVKNASSEDSKRKLEGIVFKIDMIKRRNKNNQLKIAMELNKLMNFSKIELSDALNKYLSMKKESKIKLVKK
jgi:hypothetical protein